MYNIMQFNKFIILWITEATLSFPLHKFKRVSYRVHCEGGMSSPGVVSPWEAVLFIQSVGQTAFYKIHGCIQSRVSTSDTRHH